MTPENAKQSPFYLNQIFMSSVEYILDIVRQIRITKQCFVSGRFMPGIIDEVEELRILAGRDTTSAVRLRETIAKDIPDMVKYASKDLEFMHSYGTIMLYSTIESLVLDIAYTMLMYVRGVRDSDQVRKIKIELAEYEAMDEAGRGRYLVDMLDIDTKSRFKSGVTRFELLLSAVSLDGNVDNSVRDGIHELLHVRNVLAHRRGIVDRKFVQACPSLGFSAGEHLSISDDLFSSFVYTSALYILELSYRVGTRFSLREEFTSSMQRLTASVQQALQVSRENLRRAES